MPLRGMESDLRSSESETILEVVVPGGQEQLAIETRRDDVYFSRRTGAEGIASRRGRRPMRTRDARGGREPRW
jgi:hypothetical protein